MFLYFESYSLIDKVFLYCCFTLCHSTCLDLLDILITSQKDCFPPAIFLTYCLLSASLNHFTFSFFVTKMVRFH